MDGQIQHIQMILKGFTFFIQYIGTPDPRKNELSKGLCELLHTVIHRNLG